LGEARRILILHATAGAGHRRAAEALEQAFRAVDPTSRVHALNTLAFASRFFQRTYAQAYDTMVKRAPKVWGLLYWGSEREPFHRSTVRARVRLDRFHLRRLERAIERFRPAAVVCTHFLPLEGLAPRAARGRLGAPLYCVITDFGAHPFWVYDGTTGYFVATDEVKEELSDWGVRASAVEVTGIPVDLKFARLVPQPEARAALGLEPDRPVVLVMGGGNGVGPLHGLAEGLLGLPSAPQVVVLCGRNEALRHRLGDLERAAPGRIRAVGYTDDVDRWLAAADVNVTKAGGLTCSESLARQVPLVIYRPTPGQEERNSRALTGAGAALRARAPQEVFELAERILARSSLARAMRQACEALGRPAAALDIARHVLGQAGAREGAAADGPRVRVRG
jgi:processive 1,2-diacylglycerol beta-glucosyltransferase